MKLYEETVIHGGSGYFEPFSLRNHTRNASVPVSTPNSILVQQQKGISSEIRFKEMTEFLISTKKLLWAKKIRKASVTEDLYHLTDFKIDTLINDQSSSPIVLRINVKSSHQYAKEFRREHPQCRVYVVVMTKNMTPDKLMRILDRFLLREL